MRGSSEDIVLRAISMTDFASASSTTVHLIALIFGLGIQPSETLRSEACSPVLLSFLISVLVNHGFDSVKPISDTEFSRENKPSIVIGASILESLNSDL